MKTKCKANILYMLCAFLCIQIKLIGVNWRRLFSSLHSAHCTLHSAHSSLVSLLSYIHNLLIFTHSCIHFSIRKQKYSNIWLFLWLFMLLSFAGAVLAFAFMQNSFFFLFPPCGLCACNGNCNCPFYDIH